MRSQYRDPYPIAFYGISAALLAIYLVSETLATSSTPIHPLVRIILLSLTCLAAFLGARIPRLNEPPDRSLCRRRVRLVMWFSFLLYLHLVLVFTLFDPGFGRQILNIFQASAEERAYYTRWFVNLSPLYTIRSIYLKGFQNGLIGLRYVWLNLAGNLFVFAPLAFFLPYLWRWINRFWKFLLCMILFSVLIESCQFITMCGSCDVDDVILNVGGALPFYLLFRLPPMQRIIRRLTAT